MSTDSRSEWWRSVWGQVIAGLTVAAVVGVVSQSADARAWLTAPTTVPRWMLWSVVFVAAGAVGALAIGMKERLQAWRLRRLPISDDEKRVLYAFHAGDSTDIDIDELVRRCPTLSKVQVHAAANRLIRRGLLETYTSAYGNPHVTLSGIGLSMMAATQAAERARV